MKVLLPKPRSSRAEDLRHRLLGLAPPPVRRERPLRRDGPRDPDDPGRRGPPTGYVVPMARAPPSPFAFYASNDGKPENLAASTGAGLPGRPARMRPVPRPPVRAAGSATSSGRWPRSSPASSAAGRSTATSSGRARSPAAASWRSPAARGGAGPAPRRQASRPGTRRRARPARSWPTGSSRATTPISPAPRSTGSGRCSTGPAWSTRSMTCTRRTRPATPSSSTSWPPQFAAHHYDLKFLIRALDRDPRLPVDQRAATPPGQDGPRLFARMPVRGMSPQQLYASFVQATGVRREAEPCCSASATTRRGRTSSRRSPARTGARPSAGRRSSRP